LARMIFRVLQWMRRSMNPHHCAIPIAVMLAAGLVHAVFEDWLIAVGYYLTVFFWIAAFWLVDLMPASEPVTPRVISPAHPRGAIPYANRFVPGR